MKRLLLIVILVSVALAGGYEMDTIVDAPTAGILQKGETDIFTELYKDNGLLLGVRVSVVERLMFGVSYGAENIVGNEEPEWHDRVEFYFKWRIMDEKPKLPALALGYDSQGHGRFYTEQDSSGNSLRRYDIKSKGFFLVGSMNFDLLGNLGLHLGGNYSMEDSDEGSHVNLFTGLDKTLGDVAVLSVEYDLAINENENWLNTVAEEQVEYFDRGYLNAGLGVYFSPNLFLQVKFNDLLKTRGDTITADRSIRLKYYFDIK